MQNCNLMGHNGEGLIADSGRTARAVLLFLAAASLLLAVGCDLANTAGQPVWDVTIRQQTGPGEGHGTVTSKTGGKVSAGNAMVSVEVPPGAVTESLELTVGHLSESSLPAPPPQGRNYLGAAWTQPEGFRFSRTVALTVPISQAGIPGGSIEIYKFAGIGENPAWVKISPDAVISSSGLFATATIGTLGKYAIFGYRGESDYLSLDAITPASGPRGSVIALTGSGFGADMGKSFVSFGEILATSFRRWSNSRIEVVVPGNAVSSQVTVSAAGRRSVPRPFIVTDEGNPPSLSTVNPLSGSAGAVITITGSRFGIQRLGSAVVIDGVLARLYPSWTDTRIEAVVPSGASSGSLTVRVAGRDSNPVSFVVTSTPAAGPVMEALSPAEGSPGDEVVVTGFGFGADRGTSKVSFDGGETNDYITWSDTEVRVRVPVTAVTGSVVLAAAGRGSNGQPFRVVPRVPVLGSVYPARFEAGAQVTLTGSGFGVQRNDSRVLFGDREAASYVFWGDNTVICNSPAEAVSGNCVVLVSGLTSGPAAYSIKPPAGWTSVDSKVSEPLTGLSFSTGGTGFACGGFPDGSGIVLRYASGSWALEPVVASSRLEAIEWDTQDTAWAVGGTWSKSVILRYSAGSWAAMESPGGAGYLAIAVSGPGQTAWAVGYDGAAAKWDGANWTNQGPIAPVTLFSVAFTGSDSGWAAGGDWAGRSGTLVRFDGVNWTTEAPPAGECIKALWFNSASDGWAVGSSGRILRYDGSSWTVAQSPTTADLEALHFTGSSDGWAVGEGGTTLRYDGSAWRKVPSPSSRHLRACRFTTPVLGWSCGEDGNIIKYAE